MPLSTAMRRGELLNTTWPNVDFEQRTVEVPSKEDTKYIWQWHIKDTDRRTFPLTDEGKNKGRPTNITVYQPSTHNNETERTRTLNLKIDSPLVRL
jgi:integrase